MFDEGEVGWPEDPPFRAPVFVVTHRSRGAWIRKGGTTFTFVATVDEALERARAAAAGRDVRISGGADLIQQCLEAAVVDELTIHLAPVLLGDGVALFGRTKPDRAALSVRDVAASPLATHLTYRVSYSRR
jgi:dihydrofolate reductase